MEVLKTKTGKEFLCNYLSVIRDPDQIYLRISASLATVASVFSNPDETSQMWYGEMYLAQYTRIVSIVPEGDTVRICLAKE